MVRASWQGYLALGQLGIPVRLYKATQSLQPRFVLLHASDGVLAVGTSLMVYSGFRFVRMAHERGVPVALLNRGRTRADDLGGLKLDADCGAVLDAVTRGTLRDDTP